MNSLSIVRRAASQMFGDIESVSFVTEQPTGEQLFSIVRKGRPDHITLTLNPNGIKATIELKKSPRSKKTDYRIFDLRQLVS